MRMKTKLLRLRVNPIAWTVAWLLCSCHDYGIVIQPVNTERHKVIENHWAAIQKVLDQHPELYYIETYCDGKLDDRNPKPGKLCSAFLILDLQSVHDAAMQNKFTGHTVQVGAGSYASFDAEEFYPKGLMPATQRWVWPSMPQGHRTYFATESKEMVQSVKQELKNSAGRRQDR